MIAGRCVLLVAGFMLFVNDDKAGPGQRREDRRTSTDDDVGPAGFYLLPLHVTLGGGQARVHDCYFFKSLVESLNSLGGQSNLRKQYDGTSAFLQDRLDGPDIKLGLSAVGDSVQESDAEPV